MFVFVDLSWRRGLCAKKSRHGTAIDLKKWQTVDAGGSAAREGTRHACGGRGAHFWLLGSAALKKAHLSSRPTVPRRALIKEPRSDFFLCFLNENEFELRNELT